MRGALAANCRRAIYLDLAQINFSAEQSWKLERPLVEFDLWGRILCKFFQQTKRHHHHHHRNQLTAPDDNGGQVNRTARPSCSVPPPGAPIEPARYEAAPIRARGDD